MKKKMDFRKELEDILLGMGLEAPLLEIAEVEATDSYD